MKPLPYVRLSHEYYVSSHNCVNDYWFTSEGDDVSADQLLAMSNDFEGTLWDFFNVNMGTDVLVYGLRAEAHNMADTIEHFVPRNANCTGDTEALPAQDVCVLDWHFPRVAAGRLARGKTYLSGVPEGSQSDGFFSNAFVNAVNDLGDVITNFGSLVDPVLQQVIFSVKNNAFEVVTTHNVQPVVKTLRRRRPLS